MMFLRSFATFSSTILPMISPDLRRQPPKRPIHLAVPLIIDRDTPVDALKGNALRTGSGPGSSLKDQGQAVCISILLPSTDKYRPRSLSRQTQHKAIRSQGDHKKMHFLLREVPAGGSAQTWRNLLLARSRWGGCGACSSSCMRRAPAASMLQASAPRRPVCP